jgi:cytochrome c-type biogenesis protein CcmF
LAVLAREYVRKPQSTQFRLIVSPLVMWIWIGGLIVFGGGLIAISPSPSAVRRTVTARSRARAARGLARA